MFYSKYQTISRLSILWSTFQIIIHYLCSTHHALASQLLFLHKLNVTSTDCTSTEKQKSITNDYLTNRHNTQYWQHLQFIGFNVKADFVTYVHTHITFHIIRCVCKVEHLLRTITLQNQSLFKGSITLETSKT